MNGPILEIVPGDCKLPKPNNLGRKKGSGNNLFSLLKMKVGDSIAGIGRKRLNSLRESARRVGIKFNAVHVSRGLYVLRIKEINHEHKL